MKKFKKSFGLDQEVISRKQFIKSNIIAYFVGLPLLFASATLWVYFYESFGLKNFFSLIFIIFFYVIFFFTIWIIYGTAFRRLIDLKHNKNWAFLYLVPYVGIMLLFYLAIAKENKSKKDFFLNIIKSFFAALMGITILLGIIFAIVLSSLSIAREKIGSDYYIPNILSELDSAIQPVGYFDNPSLFDSETITDEDWFSHLIYYDLEKNDSVFDDSKTRFPNQRDVFSSVVKIVCQDDEYFYYGSGTNLDGSGLVLTNRHVIYGMDGDNCVVGFPNPESGLIEEAYWATPIFDEDDITEHDLAYLSIEAPVFDGDNNIYGYYERFEGSFPYFESPEKCSSIISQLGDELFIIGYPPLSGGGLTITNGLVSSLYSPSGYIITSAKIVNGNSGGSAIDKDGCFVGVPTAIYYEEDSEYLGEIIDAEFVVEFMDAISDELKDYNDSL